MDSKADSQKLLKAMQQIIKDNLLEKARLGLDVCTDDGTGVMRTQKAIDVWRRLYGELPNPNTKPQ